MISCRAVEVFSSLVLRSAFDHDERSDMRGEFDRGSTDVGNVAADGETERPSVSMVESLLET